MVDPQSPRPGTRPKQAGSSLVTAHAAITFLAIAAAPTCVIASTLGIIGFGGGFYTASVYMGCLHLGIFTAGAAWAAARFSLSRPSVQPPLLPIGSPGGFEMTLEVSPYPDARLHRLGVHPHTRHSTSPARGHLAPTWRPQC